MYAALPSDQRASAVILAENFGEAGAVDEYGPARGLPHAYSGHLSYWLWGPPPGEPQTVIAIGMPRAYLESEFESVQDAGTIAMPYGIENYEYGQPIFVCSKPRVSLAQWWPSQQHYS